MAFTVRDFEDLIRLLDQHPEWVEALRQRLLTEELLQSPQDLRRLSTHVMRAERSLSSLTDAVQALVESVAALAEAQRRTEEYVRQLAEAQRRTEEHVRQLAEAQRHIEERVGHIEERVGRIEERVSRLEEAVTALAEAQRRTEEQVQQLAEAQRRTEEQIRQLAEAQRRTEEQVQQLAEAQHRLEETLLGVIKEVNILSGLVRGWIHENQYRTRSRRYRRLVQDPHILSAEEREALIRSAEAAGRLTAAEVDSLDEADVIVQGNKLEGEGIAYLVVEVSAIVHTNDVDRAVERAAALRKVFPEAEVIPAVAGPEIHLEAARMAQKLGVWWLKDGRVFPPQQIPIE
ncbi:MAG: hypothetical protein NZM16_04055 [Thermoflexus sp.]|uniref:hypothetical protein n=1 Tax=Thermoflexus sp. TaxID=1969742 RepID=UPI0025DE3EC6|nr:hypothetical protein [Thermoflexus sp.]MCS6963199.1 hypothetical protein [Thermoflexus sp.]MDW8184456.1 hypothetical protein [Anaerolineae bacterium]